MKTMKILRETKKLTKESKTFAQGCVRVRMITCACKAAELHEMDQPSRCTPDGKCYTCVTQDIDWLYFCCQDRNSR